MPTPRSPTIARDAGVSACARSLLLGTTLRKRGRASRETPARRRGRRSNRSGVASVGWRLAGAGHMVVVREGVTAVGAVSGPARGGELVAGKLGEVVGRHQQLPFGAHGRFVAVPTLDRHREKRVALVDLTRRRAALVARAARGDY